MPNSFIWKPIWKNHDRASTPLNKPFLRRVSIKLATRTGLASLMRKISSSNQHPQNQQFEYDRDYKDYFPAMHDWIDDSTAGDGSSTDSVGVSMDVSKYLSDGVMTDSDVCSEDIIFDYLGDSSHHSMALSGYHDGYITDRDPSLPSLCESMSVSEYRSGYSASDPDLSEIPLEDSHFPEIQFDNDSMVCIDQPTPFYDDDIMDVSAYSNNECSSYINHPSEDCNSFDTGYVAFCHCCYWLAIGLCFCLSEKHPFISLGENSEPVHVIRASSDNL